MEYVNTLLQNPQQALLCLLSGLFIIILIFAVRLQVKVSKLEQRYQQMMQGMEGITIERMLLNHIHEVNAAVVAVEHLKAETGRLETILQSCIQRVGLVRFNAFDDTGSDLSFSLALLDERNNGLVISSLYGRNESRIYAKPVSGLQSKYVLSAEEQKALQSARESASAVSQANAARK